MKTLLAVVARVLMVAGLGFTGGNAMAFVLPAGPCTGSNCLQYTDFSVYSLALLNLQGGGDGSPSAGEPGYVSATPGAIKDFTVIGLNANNQPAQTNASGVDNAYNTPSGGVSTFTTLTSDTANGPSDGDGNSWQASMSTLRTAFVGSEFVAFFAFTEEGSSDPPTPLTGADLLVWAKISLIDLQNPGATQTFYLQPTGSALNDDPLASALPPDTTIGDSGPWVYVHSKMCVLNNTTFTGFPDANGVCAVGSLKNTNTGQNNASFAVFNAAVDAAVHDADTAFDILQIDWEMAYLSGDGETAWFQPFGVANIPEPSTLMLLALALLGLWTKQRTYGRRIEHM